MSSSSVSSEPDKIRVRGGMNRSLFSLTRRCAAPLLTLLMLNPNSVVMAQTPPPVRLADPIHFVVPVSSGLNPPMVGSTVGDFSGDGIPDVALVVDFFFPFSSTESIRCFLGDGHGSFYDPVLSTFPATSTLTGVLDNADFDQDGQLDVVAGWYNPPPTVVLRGDGLGGFTSWGTAGVATSPEAMAIGDLDGDGDPDVLLTSQGPNTVLEPALNNGPGYFGSAPGICYQLPVFLSNGYITLQSALLDLNQDSQLDYVSGNGLFAVLAGLGGGCFANGSSSAIWSTTGPPSMTSTGRVFAFADFNNDGFPDLVLATPYSAGAVVDLAVWMHDPAPAPSWTLTATFADPGCPLGVTSGDFDLDGSLDFVLVATAPDTCTPATSTGNRLVVYRNLGAGTSFQAIPFTAGYAWRPRRPVIADVNVDGWPDVVHDFVGVPGSSFPGFAVTLNAAAFQSPTLIGMAEPGRAVHVYLEGATGGLWFLLLAACQGAPISIPGVQGVFSLDLSSLVLFDSGTFPPDGNLNIPLPIPNDPSLVGQRAVLQHLTVGPPGATPAFGAPLGIVIQ